MGVVWFVVCAVGGFLISRRLSAKLTDRLVGHGTRRQQRLATWGLIVGGGVAVGLSLGVLLRALR